MNLQRTYDKKIMKPLSWAMKFLRNVQLVYMFTFLYISLQFHWPRGIRFSLFVSLYFVPVQLSDFTPFLHPPTAELFCYSTHLQYHLSVLSYFPILSDSCDLFLFLSRPIATAQSLVNFLNFSTYFTLALFSF